MNKQSITEKPTITVTHLKMKDNGGRGDGPVCNGLYYNLLADVPKVAHDQPQMGPGNWKESTHN